MIFTALAAGVLGKIIAKTLQNEDGKKYDLFISYSRRDKSVVEKFMKAFDNCGLTYWLDYINIKDGDFAENILRGIDDSRAFLYLHSNDSDCSQWKQRELHYAVSKKEMQVIPIKLDTSPKSSEIDYLLCNYEWIQYDEHKLDKIIEKIKLAVISKTTSGETDESQLESQPKTVVAPLNKSNANLHNTTIQKQHILPKCKVKVVADAICTLMIDGDTEQATVMKTNEIVSFEIEEGEYILSFENVATSTIHTEVLVIEEGKKSKALKINFADIEKKMASTVIRCFMAGSTELISERDAFRAVVSETDNKWNKYNVKSYTYKDFSRAYREGGNQEEYNYFIAQQTDFMVFVLTGRIGDKTREELEAAKNSYKSTHHPKILIYVLEEAFKKGIWDTGVDKWIEDEKLYVIPYQDIKDLKMQIYKDLNEYLLNRNSQS